MRTDATDEILARLAPCGLYCGGCLAFRNGPIHEAATRLKEGLGPNFAAYAERFVAMNPAFADYPAFARLLDVLAEGGCTGCRGQGCLFQDCKVPGCARSNGVDFCFQCADFPCDRHGLPPAVAERWQRFNERMKTEGVRQFYYWIKDKRRYP